jgi:hypothetical protein
MIVSTRNESRKLTRLLSSIRPQVAVTYKGV